MGIFAVTGSTGYIGKVLCSTIRRNGGQVIELVRAPIDGDGTQIPYDLSKSNDLSTIPEFDYLIHLASQTEKGSSTDETLEMRAAEELIQLCTSRNRRFVYISSQSASAMAPTAYGRSKWQIETMVLKHQGVVIRPGFVYGGEREGLYGKLCRIAEVFPIVPKILPEPKLQLIQVNDLCEAIYNLTKRDEVRAYDIADNEQIEFSLLLSSLAKREFNKKIILIPVPIRCVYIILRLMAFMRLSIIDPDRLRSLVAIKKTDTLESLKLAGVADDRQDLRAANTLLQLEAITLFRYLVAKYPSRKQVDQYVRYVEHLDSGSPLYACEEDYKYWKIHMDDAKGSNKKLNARINAATYLAESSTEHSATFLTTNSKPFKTVVSLILAGIRTLPWFIVRLIRQSALIRNS